MRGLKGVVTKVSADTLTIMLEIGTSLECAKVGSTGYGDRVVVYYDMVARRVKFYHKLEDKTPDEEEVITEPAKKPEVTVVEACIIEDEATDVSLPQLSDWGIWDSGY